MVNIYPSDGGPRGTVSGPGQASGTGSFKNSVSRPQGSLKRSKSFLGNILGPAFEPNTLDISLPMNEDPVFTIEK